jgi:hypothetical protein
MGVVLLTWFVGFLFVFIYLLNELITSDIEIDLEIFFSLLCLSTPSWLWIIIAIYAKFKE